MGACDFTTTARGKTAKEAFAAARSQAQYDHGHSGYSGTIAEKHEFVMIDVPKDQEPAKFVRSLVQDGDPRIDDKWGPAGCIKLDGDAWLFFGYASS
jgi:hypothetical protein